MKGVIIALKSLRTEVRMEVISLEEGYKKAITERVLEVGLGSKKACWGCPVVSCG
jgi:hypothetical protein